MTIPELKEVRPDQVRPAGERGDGAVLWGWWDAHLPHWYVLPTGERVIANEPIEGTADAVSITTSARGGSYVFDGRSRVLVRA